jgi:hypothetical protein
VFLFALGMPAIALAVAFVVIGAVPVWFGAKVTDARNPTLIRSILALIAGTIGSIIGFALGGPVGILLAPIAYLLAFKFILGTSLFGGMILGILSLTGYALMGKFMGGEPPRKNETTTRFESVMPIDLYAQATQIDESYLLPNAVILQ